MEAMRWLKRVTCCMCEQNRIGKRQRSNRQGCKVWSANPRGHVPELCQLRALEGTKYFGALMAQRRGF